MSGVDENDLTTQEIDKQAKTPLQKRLAVPNQVFTSALDSRVEQMFRQKLTELREQGFQVDFIDFPLLKHAGTLYYILMSAELTSNLGRFDGMRF